MDLMDPETATDEDFIQRLEYDEDCQLKHGQQLLDKAQLEKADGTMAVEAVKWLIKSSRVGNEKATELLKMCLSQKLGIIDTNVDDVQWCIATSVWEKRSRSAASKLFRKICLEDRNLTKREYNERVAGISRNKLEKKLLEKAAKNGLSEEAFVNRVMNQLQGKTGWSLKSFMRTDIDGMAYGDAPLYKKIIFYPGKTLTWIVDNIIETAGTQGMAWLKTIIPVHQVYMLVILFIYSLISLDTILWVLPIMGFYISFASIVICTMQMFYAKRKLNDIRALADVLDRFSETFIQESAESAYSWSSLTPYVTFFTSLPFLIVTFVVADKTWIPCSEITCISFLITVASWFALSDNYDHLAMIAILLDNISTLPNIVASLPRIPLVSEILNFIAGSGLSVEVLPDVHFKLGLPSLAYLIVPIILIRMAMRKSWQGSYQIMIPHLVCFLWWRIAVMFFLDTSWYGLMRASFGWTIMVILSPFLFIIAMFWLVVTFLKIFSLSGILKIMTTLCLLGGVALFAYWSRGGFKFGSYSLEKKSSKTNLILTLILLTSPLTLVYISVPDDTGKTINYLPWDVYKEHCSDDKWESSLAVQTMVNCHHFTDAKVNWTGQVTQIIIKKIDNQAETIVGLLPTFLSDWLRCTYGTEYNCTGLASKAEEDICAHNALQNKNCHLKNLNQYTYEIEVAIDDKKVKLLAPHIFTKSLLKLRKDDSIQFRGHLFENLGNTAPVVKIYKLLCLSCMEQIIAASEYGQNEFANLLKLAIYRIFNFFFSPLFVFK